MAFRLATWPSPDEFARTPYTVAFYEAMKRCDVEAVTALTPATEWVQSNAASVDALHIHWPDGLWRRRTKGDLLARLRKASEFRRFLQAARASGLKIIWTIHNFGHHEGASWLDRCCYRMLAGHANLLICHSHWSAQIAEEKYRAHGRVVIVPHGSFPGVYPAPRPREAVLRELGLRGDVPTVCAVGNLRVYKGVDVAAEAVQRLNGAVQLIVAGRAAGRRMDIARLREQVVRSNRGVVLDKVLDNQEFSDIVGASEAVLLPYRKITTSGVLLTAWTLGRGVVASDLPYFREIARGDAHAAHLFAAGNAEAMSEAIRKYLLVPAAERGAAARRLAEFYSWERCVLPLCEVINRWRSERHASTR